MCPKCHNAVACVLVPLTRLGRQTPHAIPGSSTLRHALRLLPAVAAVTVTGIAASGHAVMPARAAAGTGPVAQLWDVAVNGTTACNDGREFPQMYSSPAMGDLRHDGNVEIVAGFPDGVVRVFDTSGHVVWSRDLGDAIAASPTLADLDGAGQLSVIVGGYGNDGVWVFDAYGNVRPGWPQHTQHGGLGQAIQPGFFSSVAVGDVFGDGRKELFASGLDQYTYGWYSDGSPMPGYPHLVSDSALATPALADLEHAHHLDIVTPSDNYATHGGKYQTYRPDGSMYWQAFVDETPWASPAVVDFGDGDYTVVNGTGEFWHQNGYPNAGKYIAGFNQDGSVRAGYPSATNAAVFESPSVGDLLGDGGREVAVVDESGMIHVVDGHGSSLFGTPKASAWSPPQPNVGFYHGGSIIAPVDVAGHNGLWTQAGPNLFGYDVVNGVLTQRASIPTTGVVFSTPAVGPLGDGTLGLVVTSDPSNPVCNQADTWNIALWRLTSAGSSLPSGAWPTFHGNAMRSGSSLPLAPPPTHGYWLVARDGGIFPFGSAAGYGSTGGIRLNQPIVGMAKAPRDDGYWLVAGDGGIFPFGPGAAGYGSTGGIHLTQPIVGMAATPSGHGYWLVASDGGIFPFGDAAGYGSTGGIHLNQPIVGMTLAQGGQGYYLVAADGGIFPFGPTAGGYGSTGGIRLNQPIVGMAATN